MVDHQSFETTISAFVDPNQTKPNQIDSTKVNEHLRARISIVASLDREKAPGLDSMICHLETICLVLSIKTSETCGGRGNSIPTCRHFVTCSVYRKSR
jgi:hypothetical protein